MALLLYFILRNVMESFGTIEMYFYCKYISLNSKTSKYAAPTMLSLLVTSYELY